MVGIDFPQQHDRMETNRDNVDGQSDLHCEGRGQTFKLFCQSRKAGVMFHDLLYVNAVCFVCYMLVLNPIFTQHIFKKKSPLDHVVIG